MRTQIQSGGSGGSRGGFSLLIVMIFTGLGFLFLSNLLRLTSSGTALAERQTDFLNARAAAEAATEKVAAELTRHFHAGGVTEVEANLAATSTLVPHAAEAPEWQDFQFSDGAGAPGATHVQRVEDWGFGPLAWKYVGDVGRRASYRVISNARRATGDFGPPAAVRQELQVASIPVFGFGVFYALDLEICSSQDFVVPGRVHCNGNIFLEPDLHTVTFEDDVTSSRQIRHEANPLDPVARTFGNVIYSGARDSQVNTLTFPIDAPNDPVLLRQLIQVPPGGESPTSPLGLLRFYNKAELIITITTTNVVGRSGRYNNFAVTLDGANPPLNQFINTNSTFFDKRENKTVVVTDFDVNRFGNVIGTGPNRLTTLLGRRPKTVYVIDTRPATAGQFSAVRLINGQALPTGGLTVATPNPLYVRGHYNTPNAHLGTANTSQSEPASLAADAVTVLSEGWSDANSSLGLASRPAAATTVTAAVLTGIVLTGPDHYNGGMENTLRLLEHWGSATLTYNGSLVVPFPSLVAVGRPATPTLTVYWPPVRQFHFDTNFRQEAKLPPATPELRTVIRSRWASIRPNTIQ